MSSTTGVPSNEQGRPRRLTFAVWRSPLARPADRTQAGLLLLGVALWLVALPIMAVAGSIAWSGICATAEHQQQTRTVATARLLADAPEFYISDHGIPLIKAVPVAAAWTGPDGRALTGTVTVTGGARSGDQMPIWIDPAGNLTAPPLSTATAAVLTMAVTVLAWLAWGAVLVVAWSLFRRRLNQGRMAEWDRQWEAVEPLWSGG